MKTIPIRWQRLVDDGRTCARCGATERAVRGAVAKLEPALRPLGLRPELETVAIDEAAFRADPAQSNRIWIAGRPMEAWLGAGVGASACCDVCGGLPCRTLEVDGATHEAIPEALIVRAAMIAAAAMLGPDAGRATSPSACCESRCGCP